MGELILELERLIAQTGCCAFGAVEMDETEPEMMAHYDRWLEANAHGPLKFMADQRELRHDPRRLLQEEGSTSPVEKGTILCFAFPYYHDTAMRITAQFAHGEDYHRVLPRRLAPVAETLRTAGYKARVCTDSAPLCERYWARRAGLGHIARNGFLAVPHYGTFVLLSEILTNAPLSALCLPPFSEPIPFRELPASCTECDLCARACPTLANQVPFLLHTSRCLACLTIEDRSDDFPPVQISHPVKSIFGCDLCQRACPLNRQASALPPLTEFLPTPFIERLDRNPFEALSGLSRRSLRTSSLSRTTPKNLLRNLRFLHSNVK